MPDVAAVVFDLDDTLYPEHAYVHSGFAAVAEAFQGVLGDPVDTVARMQRLFDPNHRRRVFNELLAQHGHADSPETAELVRRMIETYRAHVPKITLDTTADTALTRLRERYKLGLVTDGRPVQQWAKIDALDLRTRFDEIIVTGDLDAGCAKPSPAAFRLIADRLGVSHDRCVYVADNAAKDFVGPNALGWTTIQITRAEGVYRDEQPAPHGKPNHQINSLEELPSRLE